MLHYSFLHDKNEGAYLLGKFFSLCLYIIAPLCSLANSRIILFVKISLLFLLLLLENEFSFLVKSLKVWLMIVSLFWNPVLDSSIVDALILFLRVLDWIMLESSYVLDVLQLSLFPIKFSNFIIVNFNWILWYLSCIKRVINLIRIHFLNAVF